MQPKERFRVYVRWNPNLRPPYYYYLLKLPFLPQTNWKSSHFLSFTTPGGGVLRYISDGDVRSPFLGLKFPTWRLFLGLTFLVTFFGWEILVRTFLGVDKKYVIYHIIYVIYQEFRLLFPWAKMYCSPLSKNDCSLFKVYDRRMINKERWRQKLSGILLNYYYLYL